MTTAPKFAKLPTELRTAALALDAKIEKLWTLASHPATPDTEAQLAHDVAMTLTGRLGSMLGRHYRAERLARAAAVAL